MLRLEIVRVDDRPVRPARPAGPDAAAARRMGDAAKDREGLPVGRRLQARCRRRRDDAGQHDVGLSRGTGEIGAVEIHQRFGMLQPRRRHRLLRPVDIAERQQVVLQVARRFRAARLMQAMPAPPQHFRVADARAHQDQRRRYRAGQSTMRSAEIRPRRTAGNADGRHRALAVELQVLDLVPGEQRQVRPRQHLGRQIGVGNAEAAAVR